MSTRSHPRFPNSRAPAPQLTPAPAATAQAAGALPATQKTPSIPEMQRAEFQARMKRGIDAIDGSLSVANARLRRRIPEAIFLREYLAVFLGEYRGDDLAERIRLWGTIADGFYSEVDIENEKGEIVAVVPSLLNRQLIRMETKRQDGGMREVVRLAGERSAANPDAANAMIYAELHKRFVNEGGLHQAQREQIEAWERLLNHYGRSLKDPKGVANVAANKASQGDDDMVFE